MVLKAIEDGKEWISGCNPYNDPDIVYLKGSQGLINHMIHITSVQPPLITHRIAIHQVSPTLPSRKRFLSIPKKTGRRGEKKENGRKRGILGILTSNC